MPLQKIRDQERRLADSRAPNAIPMQRAQIVLAHQPSDTMLTAGFSGLSQIEEDAGSAINAMARDERCANQSKESGVFLIVVRNRSLQPKVVAADRDPEDAAHHLDAVLISMGLNEGVGRSILNGDERAGDQKCDEEQRRDVVDHCLARDRVRPFVARTLLPLARLDDWGIGQALSSVAAVRAATRSRKSSILKTSYAAIIPRSPWSVVFRDRVSSSARMPWLGAPRRSITAHDRRRCHKEVRIAPSMFGSSLLQRRAWMIIAGVVSWLFARDGTREVVATRARVAGRPEQIWDRIMFYEDVPGRPAFPLRALLPAPVRTDGDKSRVGATYAAPTRWGAGQAHHGRRSSASAAIRRHRAAAGDSGMPPHARRFVPDSRQWRRKRRRAHHEVPGLLAPPVVLAPPGTAARRPAPLAASCAGSARRPFVDIHTAARRPLNPAHARARFRRCDVLGIAIGLPPLALIRASVAAVWLYEGLWCKLLGGARSQVEVVTAVPRLGPRVGPPFLKALGLVEVAIAVWVLTANRPGLVRDRADRSPRRAQRERAAVGSADHHIPAGMVVKNIAFLVLAWVCGAMPARPL